MDQFNGYTSKKINTDWIGNAAKQVGNTVANTAKGLWSGIEGIWGQLTGSSAKNEAQKEREWQTEMSNTGYQRAAEDMKAAGINPAVAFGAGGQGNAASSSPGASAANNTGDAIPALALTAKILALSKGKGLKW